MLTNQDHIRISVGIEHIDDIIADFEQSFRSTLAAPATGEKLEDATVIGTAKGEAKLVV
jgi:O-acetylhomoserine/O-acetylserine sulfhydrylase